MTDSTTSAARPRRRNHWWGPIDDPRALEPRAACQHCGLVERTGYYLNAKGRTLSVIQWFTPAGTLLRIRPVVHLTPSHKGTRSIAEAFPAVEVGGVPECPKTPSAWTVHDQPTGR